MMEMTILPLKGMNKKWIKDKALIKTICNGNHYGCAQLCGQWHKI